MAHLALWLLGTFEVTVADRPVTAFEYDKVRALLAYLAVEAAHPHRRETLAGLLWPERSERLAHRSLSQALFKLRQAIGDPTVEPPFLLITPPTLQLNPASDHWLDVTAFTGLLAACQTHPHYQLETCAACMARLQQAVALYRGPFLDGFSVGDSPAFEEWLVLTRERLHRLVYEAHGHLAAYFERHETVEQALHHARQQAELEPWREEVHRQLMRLLAVSGQRGAALAQYESCRHLLATELGLVPEAETLALFEQIRASKLSPRGDHAEIPPPPRPPPLLPFVAREQELARLHEFLDKALAGQGKLVFVTGGPGRGKTSLLWEFARQAQVTQPELIVVAGLGSAPTGVGDPYLPFREILGQLTGDVEAMGAAGPVDGERLQRLWPAVWQILGEVGPDLSDAFLPGAEPGRPLAGRPGDFFEQYTRLLRLLAEQQPLLLLLDDLQWADRDSINLLFHLGRRLGGSRILIVGAYRPVDVALGQAGGRHPLEPVVNEFQRLFGAIEIDLSVAEGRRFIEAWLDSEPNHLDRSFRQTLYRHTAGHPLFTVELLRGMQSRGDLLKDEAGYWVAGPRLDWESLPARIEAVIAEQLERLPQPLRQALTVASIEGETFTAEVVAEICAVEPAEMVRQLSDIVERTHRLVTAEEVRRQDGQQVSLYRFRHALVRHYLYNQLDPAEQLYLRQAVSRALEKVDPSA